jgi:hypothetical protein
MNKKDIANMIANIKRIGKLIVVTCPKCKEHKHDNWYIYGVGYVCQECWEKNISKAFWRDVCGWMWLDINKGR